MNGFWMKFLKIGLPLLLVVGVLAGAALPVAAADPPKTDPPKQPVQPNLVRGKVTAIAVDKSSFTIQTGDKTQVIKVDPNTKYYKMDPAKRFEQRQDARKNLKERLEARKEALKNRIEQKKNAQQSPPPAPNKPGQRGLGPRFDEQALLDWAAKNGVAATFADIAVGDMVTVRLMPNESLAKLVIITKPPNVARVQGTISDITANTLVIKPATGDAVTLKWDAATRFVLHGIISVQKGQAATAVYDKTTFLAKAVDVKTA